MISHIQTGVEFCLSWIAGSDAASEAESVRDGLLSYATEWHSFIIGFGLGLVGVAGVAITVGTALGVQGWERVSNRKALKELQQEPWYGIFGSILAYGARNFDQVLSFLPW